MSEDSASIPWLDPDSLSFPPIEQALEDPNGLLAVGGDLSPARLLEAYRHGIFPWYENPQPILWWSPSPRAVLFPQNLHINRSLRKQLRRESFTLSVDHAFDDVIEACAGLSPKRPGTWITTAMKQAYIKLHQLGWAHSFEVWTGGRLIGGLYGIAIGELFFGESMFSHRPNASKIALLALCDYARHHGIKLIDCQVGNDYLYSMGAENIDRAEFQHYLAAYARPELRQPGAWQLTGELTRGEFTLVAGAGSL